MRSSCRCSSCAPAQRASSTSSFGSRSAEGWQRCNALREIRCNGRRLHFQRTGRDQAGDTIRAPGSVVRASAAQVAAAGATCPRADAATSTSAPAVPSSSRVQHRLRVIVNLRFRFLPREPSERREVFGAEAIERSANLRSRLPVHKEFLDRREFQKLLRIGRERLLDVRQQALRAVALEECTAV